MLRGFWQRAKDFVYNSVISLFRTQEEIDTEVGGYLGDYGTYITDPADLPTDAHIRPKGLFMSPDDARRYVDGFIPAEYVTILVLPDFEGDDTFYQVYVSGGKGEE